MDFELKREELARYGMTIAQAEMAITSAVGGENISTTVEGRERYPVNVRYFRDYRSTIERLNRTLVSTMDGKQIPMAQIADIKLLSGPGMIRDENGRLSGYVYVDIAGRDVGGYVADAKKGRDRQGAHADRLHPCLERPVRIHAAGGREAAGSRSHHHFSSFFC